LPFQTNLSFLSTEIFRLFEIFQLKNAEKPFFSSLPIQQANLARWILRFDFSIFYGKDGKDVKYTFFTSCTNNIFFILGVFSEKRRSPLDPAKADFSFISSFPLLHSSMGNTNRISSLAFLLLVVVFGACFLGVAYACSSDTDCYLNGVCTNGACICDLGWVGTYFIPFVSSCSYPQLSSSSRISSRTSHCMCGVIKYIFQVPSAQISVSTLLLLEEPMDTLPM
jgi:hypothetical protein